MKTLSRLALSVPILALALSFGCQSSGHDKAEATGTHMDAMKTAAVALKEKVNAVATSLATLIEKADVDPKAPFEQYSSNVAALKDGTSRVESQLATIKSEGQAYFAEWEKQSAAITDPELQKKAEERRLKLTKAVDAVNDAMTAAGTELAPYVKSSGDVQTYLKNDLTPAGIKSVADKSKQATKDAKAIGKKLDDVVEALDKAAPEFKMAKPPPPPAEKKT